MHIAHTPHGPASASLPPLLMLLIFPFRAASSVPCPKKQSNKIYDDKKVSSEKFQRHRQLQRDLPDSHSVRDREREREKGGESGQRECGKMKYKMPVKIYIFYALLTHTQ